MARLFISHNSNDAREAVALKRWLADNGWNDVFLDIDAKDGLTGDEKWSEALIHALDRSEAALFLISPTWLSSPECRGEYTHARYQQKHLFITLIKPCDPTGRVSSDLQWSPLFGDGIQTTITFDFRGQPTKCTFLADGLERLKYGLIKAGIIADYFAWPPENDPKRAPYRGLNPLEAEDAAIFFGRDAQIQDGMETLRNLRTSGSKRLLVILGASGSGKSSFMRAGLLPRLNRDDRHFFLLSVIRPRNAVISGPDGLAQSFARAFGELGVNITLGWIKQELDSGLQAFNALLADLKQRLFERVKGEADAALPCIVIPVDQGEELFNPDGAQEAERFLAFLAYLLDELNADAGQPVSAGSLVPVIVLLTIRTDRYERLQLAPGQASVKKPEVFDLRPIPPEQFERVINGPAERSTRAGRKLIIEPSLTERLLDDFKKGADTLPLLGFVLEKLYLEYGTDGDLTLKEYQRIRGNHPTVQAAIFVETINSVLKELYPSPATPEERKEQEQALRQVFIPYLVRINPEDGEPLRQVAKFGKSPGNLPEDVRPFVDRLVKARLLTQNEGDTIEVAHESLLRQWPSLYGWIKEERDNLRLLENIRQSAAEWKKELRSEDRRDGLLIHQESRLTDALTLLAKRGYAVSEDSDERIYLNACIAKQEKRVAKEKKEQEQRIRDAERIAEEQTKAAKAAEDARVTEEKRRIEADAFAKRSRKQTLIARAIAAVAVLSFFVASWSTHLANERRIESEASALWQPLNFPDTKISEDQAKSLLTLARSNDSQKSEFLEQLLQKKSATRAVQSPA